MALKEGHRHSLAVEDHHTGCVEGIVMEAGCSGIEVDRIAADVDRSVVDPVAGLWPDSRNRMLLGLIRQLGLWKGQ